MNHKILRQGLALAIGLVGAFLAVGIGIPLPWMLGPMILVMAFAVGGAPVVAPTKLRAIFLPVLGVMLGAGFHPEIIQQIRDWILILAFMPAYLVLAFATSILVYRKLGRYDPVTAYFASAPAGLNDMTIIGGAAGGDEKRIALAHAGRIFLVVTFVVFVYSTFFEVTSAGGGRPYVPFSALEPPDLLILVACGLVGAYLGPKARLPAPNFMGPMILSGAVHMAGLTSAATPTLAVNTAQLVMGTVVGCRFAGVKLQEIGRDASLSVLASAAMLIVALVTAYGVTLASGIGMREAFLAFSPGGLAEMSLLALAMHANVALVATVHVARIIVVIAAAPVAFRLMRKRSAP